MTTTPHKLLLVEDDDIDIEVVQRYLSIAGDHEFQLVIEKSARAAAERLQGEAFALILMDLRLPDSVEDQTFLTIRGSAGNTPIVVLTGTGDEREGAKMIRLGAQDYLVKGRFDAFLLVRVIRYALERWALLREVEALRLKEKQNQEFQLLEDYTRTVEGQTKPRPLREMAPAYFEDLLQRYSHLLDQAMQRRIYKQDGVELQDGIRNLTRELGQIKAGPREIVEIHSSSLQAKLSQPTEIKNQVYLEEGRLLLLEIMGAMVKEYRGTKEVNYEPIRDQNTERRNRLDRIAEGGIPEGALTLLSGTAGSAKTVFAVQFLAAGVLQHDQNAVLVTFEERPAQMRRHMLSLGWDIESWEAQGKWAFVDASPYTDSEQIHVGTYNLEGLLARITHAIQKVGAKRVAIDSLGTMFSQIPDQQVLRSELFRIIQELQKLQVTTILTAERFSERDELNRYGIEEFVADNVIILRHVRESDKRRRTVEILKFRGTTYQNGEFPFSIVKNKGIEVISLNAESGMQSAPRVRMTSGNPRLDEMCGGGFLGSSIVLVSGATGTGKTLTTTQFIGAGASIGERCLFFAFEESREQIFRNAQSWGHDFKTLEAKGNLRLAASYPESASLNDHFIRIKTAIEEYKPQRIAIDSLSAIERVSSPRGFREFIINLAAFLKERGILTMCTSTTPALLGGASITEAHISTITDSIILLRYVEIFGEMRRGVMVLKMRGSSHNKEIKEFVINDQGMVIGKAFQNVIGIISGNASIVSASDELSRVDRMFAEDT